MLFGSLAKIVRPFSTSRQRLAEFFKMTHPDVMSNAPEKIKEENLRSTKSLNYYLDQVSQNKGHPLTQLSFYVADKDNQKSRKFLLFQVDLLPLKGALPAEQLKGHIDKTVSMLLNSVMQVKVNADPFLKKQMRKNKRSSKIEEKEEKDSWQDDQYEVSQLRKEHFNLEEQLDKEAQRQSLNYSLFSSIAQERHSKVLSGIEQQLHSVDRANTKALSWAKLIMADNKHSRKMQSVFYQLIDPRMIFFAPDVTSAHFDAFMETLTNLAETKTLAAVRHLEMLKAVFQDMETQQPQLYLQVGLDYDAQAMPGFMAIPYNFSPETLYEFYYENKYTMIDDRRQFELMLDLIKKEKKSFGEQFRQSFKIQRAKSLADSEEIYLEVRKLNQLLLKH